MTRRSTCRRLTHGLGSDSSKRFHLGEDRIHIELVARGGR